MSPEDIDNIYIVLTQTFFFLIYLICEFQVIKRVPWRFFDLSSKTIISLYTISLGVKMVNSFLSLTGVYETLTTNILQTTN